MRRVVHECVASKLEIVPLRAQLPSIRVISLVFYTAAVKKAKKKERKKKHIQYMSGCPQVLLLKSSQ